MTRRQIKRELRAARAARLMSPTLVTWRSISGNRQWAIRDHAARGIYWSLREAREAQHFATYPVLSTLASLSETSIAQ